MALILGTALLLERPSVVVAADVQGPLERAAGNLTILNNEIAPGWADSPTYRGTSGILWSCIVTLTACIYTAIHLNIPTGHRSTRQRMLAKVKWATIALFGPEVVVYVAVTQWRAASMLIKTLNSLQQNRTAEDAEEGETPSKRDYSLEYGFWVVMGGFSVDVSDIHDTCKRQTLTVQAVEHLARQGHFLDLPEGQISDRSKANFFAKLLVCIQVAWMVIQCICRKVVGYPLTLLEIHTMVHVVCALCIYLLWWRKPLDVEEPIVVTTEALQESLALMFMCSRGSDYDARNAMWYPDPRLGYDYIAEELLEAPDTVRVRGRPDAGFGDARRERTQEKDTVATIHPGQFLDDGIGPCGASRHLNKRDIRRWTRAGRALTRMQAPHTMDSLFYDIYVDPELKHLFESLSTGSQNIALELSPYYDGLAVKILGSIVDKAPLVLTAILLPIVYGGVHLSAWEFEFPSFAEQMLWKICCFGIMGTFPIVLGGFYCLDYCLEEFLVTRLTSHRTLATILECLQWMWFLIYSIFRGYIVVEAFLSLRHMPLGVYKSIPWVQSLPHL